MPFNLVGGASLLLFGLPLLQGMRHRVRRWSGALHNSFCFLFCSHTGAVRRCRAADNDVGEACIAAVMSTVRMNFVLRVFDVAPAKGGSAAEAGRVLLSAELRCHYRVPHVRLIVRTRAMCQAGRARAAGARGDIVAWMCERAPLWVVVHVCALLRGSELDGMDLF